MWTSGKKATRPCPCGYLGDAHGQCRCTPGQVVRYRNRLSGPFLDRIDLHVEVLSLTPDELSAAPPGEASAAVRARVREARERQLARQSCANAALGGETIAADHLAEAVQYRQPGRTS
jgi:magnesium chelatase family protein